MHRPQRLAMCNGLLFLLAATAAQAAEGDGLRRCRAVAEAAARLACYDALPLADLQPAAAAPAPGAAPASRPVADPAAGFGLAVPAPQVQEISSSIRGHFEGWRPGTRIELANGQVWEITDDVSAVYELDNPKVTVRRAALGSFMLDIEGAGRSPRVRRVK